MLKVQILACLLLIAGIVLLLGLGPKRIGEDIMGMLSPDNSLLNRSKGIRRSRKRSLYTVLVRFRTALAGAGYEERFSLIICASIVLFAGGILAAVLIGNVFLIPVFSCAFALIPFLYVSGTLAVFEKKTAEELETTLSIITNSYLRQDDIISAVSENLGYIRPPLAEVFRSFVGDASSVSSNTKAALYRLRDKVDNGIFCEWVETLIQCQDDKTLKDTLRPIVDRLADVRIVNSELRLMLAGARNEYFIMAAMVPINIPIIYVLNKDWYKTLMFSTPGRIVLGICGITIFVTALLMFRFTRPVDYGK